MELQEGSHFGPYRIVARVGRGGMAEVYLAQRTGPGGFARDVVIKRILPHLNADPEFVRMFVNEAAILARLTHSNIAQVYDFGRIEDSFYLAMEYVSGTSLDRLLAVCTGTGLPIIHAVRVGGEIARGLDYAHRATDAHGRPLGIVHSDVSPSNVLLSFEGEVKLIDFGIARAGKGHDAERGTIRGKVRYMSPEQVCGRRLDPRTDVFSLGVVLWESLTGANLFDQEEPAEVLQAIQDQASPPPSSLRKEIPDALDLIVLRALEKDAEARFQRAEELAQALDLFLADHHLHAGDPSLAELVRSRFAPTLLVSIRDETAVGPPPAQKPPAATVVAVPDGGVLPGPVPDTVRDHAQAAAAPIPPPKGATPFELAHTVIDGAPDLLLPPPVGTPLPAPSSAPRPESSVLVAEPAARKGDSARARSAEKRKGDSERLRAAASARPGDSSPLRMPGSRTGDSDRIPVPSVPITAEARRGPDTTTGWIAASWRTWSPGTRLALGFAGLAVVAAIALLAFVALTGSPPGTATDSSTVSVAAPSDAAGLSTAIPADVAGPREAGSTDAPAGADAPIVPPDARSGVPDAVVPEGRALADSAAAPDASPEVPATSDGGGGRDAAPAAGKVTIDSRPWTTVTWRGRPLGETPVVDAVLPAGLQILVLTDGSGRTFRRPVRVVPGRSVRIRFDLDQE